MTYFLIKYNRRTGTSDVREFTDGSDALRERFALEREHRGDRDMEIVVLDADSREALMKTHSRYFRSVTEIASAALATLTASQRDTRERG